MSSLTLSLPDKLRAFIDAEVEEGGYGAAEEYLGALIREAQARKSKERLEAMLMDDLSEVDAAGLTADQWVERKRQHREHGLAELRREMAEGIEQLERGEGLSADDVFRQLLEKNRQA